MSKLVITNELIYKTKLDLIEFRNSHPAYKLTSWLRSDGNARQRFLSDYMKSRGLTENEIFYEQMMYFVMCNEWKKSKLT